MFVYLFVFQTAYLSKQQVVCSKKSHLYNIRVPKVYNFNAKTKKSLSSLPGILVTHSVHSSQLNQPISVTLGDGLLTFLNGVFPKRCAKTALWNYCVTNMWCNVNSVERRWWCPPIEESEVHMLSTTVYNICSLWKNLGDQFKRLLIKRLWKSWKKRSMILVSFTVQVELWWSTI